MKPKIFRDKVKLAVAIKNTWTLLAPSTGLPHYQTSHESLGIYQSPTGQLVVMVFLSRYMRRDGYSHVRLHWLLDGRYKALQPKEVIALLKNTSER